MSNNTNLGMCDMVLAISQDAINKQFATLHQRSIIQQNWNIVIDQDEKGNITDVITNLSIADFQAKIDKKEFAYAFSANINAPTISVLQNERLLLDFLVNFQSGTLYVWTGHGADSKLQPIDMKDWVYAFKTGIGSVEKTADHTNWITPESRDHCIQLCQEMGLPQNLFLAESLFLDFDNVNYSEYDQTKSKITSDILVVKVFQNLLSNYLKKLANTNNPYILAYGIKIKDASSQFKSLFSPTSLRYSTSYNNNSALSAFNFLMMIGGNTFPSGQNVGILPNGLITGAGKGRMEIDRGAFSSVLGRLISPSLNGLCIVPKSSIHCNTISIKVDVSFSGDPGPHTYQYVNDGSSRVLTFNYSKSSHDSDTSGTFFPPFAIWGNITTTISVQSDVYLEGNVIRINTTTDCYMHLNTEGGVSSGDLIKYNSEMKYTVGVDSNGKLTVSAGTPSFKDQSSFDTSGWAKFLSLGKIDDMVNSLKNFWSVMKQFMTGQQNYISMVINGSNCWAFPLGKIYTYTNVQFSNIQDLAADANYTH